MNKQKDPLHINLTVIFKGKKSGSAELEAELKALTKASRTEDACLQYDLHHSSTDREIFILHETWASQEGLDLHNNMEHLKHFQAVAPDLLEEPATIYTIDFIL